MLSIDIVGLIITICLVGFRYPHYALTAAVINALGQITMAIFLAGNVEKIVTAGAFSSTVVTNLGGLKTVLFASSGPLANFIISKFAGGIAFVSTNHIVNPVVLLKNPLAVINFRFAIISLVLSVFQLL